MQGLFNWEDIESYSMGEGDERPLCDGIVVVMDGCSRAIDAGGLADSVRWADMVT